MRVLCISDTVAPELDDPASSESFGQFDFIISCGDLPPEYLSRLSHRFNTPLYYVKGNHDIRYNHAPPMGCVNAHGRIIHHNSVKILGLEGSRWYNGGPYQYTEPQMRAILRGLRIRLWLNKGVDIIISHSPPRYIHDREDQCHKGFEIFNKTIKRYGPRYFLHGHIHASFKKDAERISTVGGTKIINCYSYYIFEHNEHEAD